MKAQNYFPDPRTATPEGIVAVGGTLNKETLTEAYSYGIFPWPHRDLPLLWFSPDPRGVLFFDDLKINKSLIKVLRKNLWTFTVNQSFKQVIIACQKQDRKGQQGTWITDEIVAVYTELFAHQQALSLEVWNGSQLVGGIYGVLSKHYFSAESMFFKESNASKYAFVQLVKYLQSLGHSWMDLQMVTSVSKSLGAKEITKSEFLNLIKV
jgi:leucyl/phenylalanyl-tRNA--protein transferase